MSPNPGEPEHNERGWTHAICGPCWDRRHPDRGPVTVSEDDPEVCCYCGATTSAGIYVRDNPQVVHGLASPFHEHLDRCAQCRDHPFALCPTGTWLLADSTAIVDAPTRFLVGEQCRLAQEALKQNHRSEAIARLHYAELLANGGSPTTIVGMSAVLKLSDQQQHEDGTTP